MRDRKAIEDMRGALRSLRAAAGPAAGRIRSRLRGGTAGPVAVPSGGVPAFFVVGMAKSGTTWLMKTLDAHPEVLCKGEGRFFGRDYRREVLAKTETRQQPSSLYNALAESEYLRLWLERSIWTRDGDTDAQMDAIVRLATEHFLAEQLRQSGKKIVGDKTPLLGSDFVKEIHAIYPEARVIHIVRDGRDQAVSFIHQQGNRAERGRSHRLSPEELARSEAYRRNELSEAEGGMFAERTLRKAAEIWADRVGHAVEDGPALFGDRYAQVRYEDLLERPDEEVARLFRFLGVDAGEKVVGRAVGAASFEKLSKGRKPGEEDPTSFYRKGVAGDWKNLFREQDKKIYKEEAGELLVRLGYERDQGW
jgi:LPS sulfotransferase NodH